MSKPKSEGVGSRRRIQPEIRLQVTHALQTTILSGAEIARAFHVSEATAHRILRILQSIDPAVRSAPLKAPTELGKADLSAGSVEQRSKRRALTADQEFEIAERIFAGTDIATDLADEYGVNKSTISRILREAESRDPSRFVPATDPAKLRRRLVAGINKAIAHGGRRGPNPKLSAGIRQQIADRASTPGTSLASLALEFAVDRSTIPRIFRALRPSSPQNVHSLDEMYSGLSSR